MPAHVPMRTCVGCRDKSATPDLLRVALTWADGRPVIVPDRRARIPGRGAWLHPVLRCLDQAERRRAFSRALRIPAGAAAPDTTGLRAWITEQEHESSERAPSPG